MRIGIAGITGRMGQLILEEARADYHDIIGGTTGRDHPTADVPLFPLAALAAQAEIVIDFTHANAARSHAEIMAASGTPWVLGTSGLSAADEALVHKAAAHIPIVYAANFGPGVNLILALARQLGAALPAADYDAEILEMHHRQKVDAPSGTAVALGRAIAAGRATTLDAVMLSGRDGHTGPRPPGAIGFAALRGGQVIGEHSVIFTSAGEQITLTHRAFDRRAFARGALRAAEWVRGHPPGLYTMVDVMGLPS